MHKTLVASLLVGLLGTAHADDAPAPDADAPAADAPGADAQGVQGTDDNAPAVRPPSSYMPAGPVLVPTGDTSDDDEEVDRTPPLSGGRLVGEALIGGVFGVGGAIGGGFAGAGLELSGGCHGEFCGLGGALLGGTIGLTFATPVGVYLVGSAEGQDGSLGATIGGSVVGTLLGIAVAAGSDGGAAWPALVLGPVVGSMIGFNATRRYDHPRRKHNVIPVASAANGSTSFGVVGRF